MDSLKDDEFKDNLAWAYRHKHELGLEGINDFLAEFYIRTGDLDRQRYQPWIECEEMVEGLVQEKRYLISMEMETNRQENEEYGPKQGKSKPSGNSKRDRREREESTDSSEEERKERKKEKKKEQKREKASKKSRKKLSKRKHESDSESSDATVDDYWRDHKGRRKPFRTDFSFTKSLPKFKGEFHQWKAFKRMVFNLVIEPKDISRHMKESIVLGKVEGEAERIWMQAISKHRKVTKAWKELKDFYENEDRVETAIQQAIVDMKPVTNTYDQTGLKELKQQVSEFAVLMDGLGVEYRSQARSFCYKIADKLWNEESKKFKTRCQNLEDVVKRLENLISDAVTLNLHHKRPNAELGHNDRRARSSSSWQQHQVNSVQTGRGESNYRKCQLCDSNDHFAANCVSTDKGRLFAVAKERKLCYRCLCYGHVSQDCRVRVRCNLCGGNHCTVQHGVSIFFRSDNRSTNNNNNSNASSNVSNTFNPPNAGGNPIGSTDSTNNDRIETVRCAALEIKDGRFWTKTIRGRQRLATLIDHGATISMVSGNVVPMKARRKGHPIVVKGFGIGMTSKMEEITEIILDSPKGPISITAYVCTVLPDDSLLIGRDEMEKVLEEESKLVHTVWGTYNVSTGNWISSRGPISNNEAFLGECSMALRWYEEPAEELIEQAILKLEVTKLSNGRFMAKLPFMSEDRPPENYEKALSKAQRLKKRLINEGLHEEYDKQVQELINLKFASKILETTGHFISHREVLRPGAESTKFRIVLTPLKLNEFLWKGETAGMDVLSHLLRFRNYLYVFTADIQKAFLQILIQEQDRKFLRFIWFEEGKPRQYQMNVLPFGVVSSPAILTTVLEKIVEELSSESKSILKGRVYMDDVITGCNDSHMLLAAIEELRKSFETAGFEMHKERSNVKNYELGGESKSVCKILGMVWDPTEDILSVNVPELIFPNTKRELLSVSGKVFDPFGLFEPLKLELKRIFAMTLQAQWDDPLPKDLLERARYQIEKIKECHPIPIPRMFPSVGIFRAFCDASQSYVGYVIYCNEQFVFGRSKVIINQRTIVDGELQAMFELFKALPKVLRCIDREVTLQVYTDSAINIRRLQKPMNDLGVLEARRVMYIMKEAAKLKVTFYHVRGLKNPADYFTRDSKPEEAIRWMTLNEESIRIGSVKEFSVDKVETATAEKKQIHQGVLEFLSRLSLGKQIKWVYRLKQWKVKTLKGRNPLADEHERSTLASLVYFYQQMEGNAPPECILANGVLVYPSRFVQIQPMWVPQDSKLADQLLYVAHQESRHRGTDMSLAMMPSNVRVQNGNRRMRSIIAACLVCRKARAKEVKQPLGPFHDNQLSPCKPWEDVCMDCFGPMTMKRGQKMWGLVVVCRTSKAVKIEAIQNMSGEVLFNVLHCLWDVIGYPRRVHTDNGTNFVYVKNRIAREGKLETTDIRWTFSTPGAPWMNGSSERMVQITKDILDQFLKPVESYFGARHRFASLERIINSRPVLSINEKWLSAFEVANCRKLVIMPEEEGTLDPHQLVRRCVIREDEMVKAWKSAFLKRASRYCPKSGLPIVEGDLFMIPDMMTRRKNWITGIVRDLKRGSDGVVRSVYLEMSSGQTNWRPVQHLIPLSIPRPEVVNARDAKV